MLGKHGMSKTLELAPVIKFKPHPMFACRGKDVNVLTQLSEDIIVCSLCFGGVGAFSQWKTNKRQRRFDYGASCWKPFAWPWAKYVSLVLHETAATRLLLCWSCPGVVPSEGTVLMCFTIQSKRKEVPVTRSQPASIHYIQRSTMCAQCMGKPLQVPAEAAVLDSDAPQCRPPPSQRRLQLLSSAMLGCWTKTAAVHQSLVSSRFPCSSEIIYSRKHEDFSPWYHGSAALTNMPE